MTLMRLSRFLTVVVIGFMSCASPAIADSWDRTFSPHNLDAILKLEPDFFDRGREQFDLEIERLMQKQIDDSDTPLLTIDESVWFDADAFEMFEAQPYLLDMAPLPEAQ